MLLSARLQSAIATFIPGDALSGVGVHHRAALAEGPAAAGGREEGGGDEADHADGHQDVTDQHLVDGGYQAWSDRPREDGAEGDEEDGGSDSHDVLLVVAVGVFMAR